jgi:hypothetical protein
MLTRAMPVGIPTGGVPTRLDQLGHGWAPLKGWASHLDTLRDPRMFPRYPDLPIPSPCGLSLDGKS